MSKDSPSRTAAKLQIVRVVLDEHLQIGDALLSAVRDALDPDMSEGGASTLRGMIRGLTFTVDGMTRLGLARELSLAVWGRLTHELKNAIPYIEWQRAVLRFHALIERAWEVEGEFRDFGVWSDELGRARSEIEGFGTMIVVALAAITPTIRPPAPRGAPPLYSSELQELIRTVAMKHKHPNGTIKWPELIRELKNTGVQHPKGDAWRRANLHPIISQHSSN